MNERFQNSALCIVGAWLISGAIGCGGSGTSPIFTGSRDPYGGQDYRQIQFKDSVSSNAANDENIADLTFTDINGEQYSLKDFRDKKHIVLVITRGYAGSVCLYCSTQTARMLTSYKKFQERNAEVVVVFPVQSTDDSQRHRDFAVAVKNKLDTPPEKIGYKALGLAILVARWCRDFGRTVPVRHVWPRSH